MDCFQREFSSLSLSFFCFGSFCRTPQGTWIDAVWVEGEHLVIEFTCGGRFMIQTVEIPNVVLCRCNMCRPTGIFGLLMAPTPTPRIHSSLPPTPPHPF